MKAGVIPTLIQVNPNVRARLRCLTDDPVASKADNADLPAIVDGIANMLSRGLTKQQIAEHYGASIAMVTIIERGYRRRIAALRQEYRDCLAALEAALSRSIEEDEVIRTVDDGVAQLIALIGGTRICE